MKNSFLLLIILFTIFVVPNTYALNKITVKLSKCIDGDTAKFVINGKDVKVRFIGINTPENSDDKKEAYGEEASEYTCSLLKSAKKIQIQYDPKSTEKDKYDRELLWVFVDDKLLQEEIIKNGYGKVAYVYSDYLYIEELKESEKIAKDNNLGVWSNEQENIKNKDENIDEISIIVKRLFNGFGEIFKKIIYLLEKVLNSML